jgi:4-hydroxy-3-methylbut-2-enyl diphosphate reductase
VQDCIEHLKKTFGATVETRTVREEDVSFPLPRELRVLASA